MANHPLKNNDLSIGSFFTEIETYDIYEIVSRKIAFRSKSALYPSVIARNVATNKIKEFAFGVFSTSFIKLAHQPQPEPTPIAQPTVSPATPTASESEATPVGIDAIATPSLPAQPVEPVEITRYFFVSYHHAAGFDNILLTINNGFLNQQQIIRYILSQDANKQNIVIMKFSEWSQEDAFYFTDKQTVTAQNSPRYFFISYVHTEGFGTIVLGIKSGFLKPEQILLNIIHQDPNKRNIVVLGIDELSESDALTFVADM